MDSIYKHTIFINVNNNVIRHMVEEVTDEEEMKKLGTEEGYVVTYGKVTELFRAVYYSTEDSRYKTEPEILKTFRSRCNTIDNGVMTRKIS